MKYLKLFEQLNDYKVKVMTANNFKDFFYNNYGYDYNLKNKIKYFDFDDLSSIWSSEKHFNSQRFIVAYNDKDILGICRFAWWEYDDYYAISYINTNKDYYNEGISKRLLEEIFKYFSKNYPNETLYMSGYTIDGWKYLRKTFLEMSEKYNVDVKEKAIEYVTNWDDEKNKLYNQSKKEIFDRYGKEWTDKLGYNFKNYESIE